MRSSGLTRMEVYSLSELSRFEGIFGSASQFPEAYRRRAKVKLPAGSSLLIGAGDGLFSYSIATPAPELVARTAEAPSECVTNLRRFINNLLIARVFDSLPRFASEIYCCLQRTRAS